MIYLAMATLVVVYVVATIYFPITVSSITAFVYLFEVGIGGYCLKESHLGNWLPFFVIACVVICFCTEIIALFVKPGKKSDKKKTFVKGTGYQPVVDNTGPPPACD